MKTIIAIAIALTLCGCVDGRTGKLFGPPPGTLKCVFGTGPC